MFAAKPTVELAHQLETMGHQENMTNAEDTWSALEDVMGRLLPAMRRAAKLAGGEPS